MKLISLKLPKSKIMRLEQEIDPYLPHQYCGGELWDDAPDHRIYHLEDTEHNLIWARWFALKENDVEVEWIEKPDDWWTQVALVVCNCDNDCDGTLGRIKQETGIRPQRTKSVLPPPPPSNTLQSNKLQKLLESLQAQP